MFSIIRDMTSGSNPQYTLASLIGSPETPTSILTAMLFQLQAGGLPTTNWDPNGVQFAILKTEATTLANLINVNQQVAQMGLLGLSQGGFLTALAADNFQLNRYLAQNAILSCQLANNGTSTQTINPFGSSFTSAYNPSLVFVSTNTGSITITAGSSTTLAYSANGVGPSYNLPNSTPLNLLTTFPGSRVTLNDIGNGTAFIQQGTNDESDTALTQRCQGKWATIGLQKNIDAYYYLVTNVPGVSTQPTKVLVQGNNPNGPGTANVFFFGPSGPLSPTDTTTITNYINSGSSICTSLTIGNATSTLIDVSADVYYQTSFTTAIGNAVTAVQNVIDAVNIGGVIYYSQIEAAIQETPGVRNVENLVIGIHGTTLSNSDINLSGFAAATPNNIVLTGHKI